MTKSLNTMKAEVSNVSREHTVKILLLLSFIHSAEITLSNANTSRNLSEMLFQISRTDK